MPVDCLVCGKQTEVTHMGMNACRACTVFYKRNHKKGDRLVCVNGSYACLDYGKSVFWCRKCRLERFQSVLKTAWGEGTSKLARQISGIAESPELALRGIDMKAHECTGIDTSQSSSPPLFLENNNNNNNNIGSVTSLQMMKCSSQTSKGPSIIEKIRANHQVLSAFRRTSELSQLGIKMDPTDANDEKYELTPSTYRLMNEGMKVLVEGLFEFASSTFPEFRTLQNAEKWLLIRNYHRCFFWMDATLRSLRRFGNRFDILYGSYTTKISLDTIDSFFTDCPDPTTVHEAAKALRARWHENVPKLRGLIRQINPTDDEFLAMIGHAFWSFECLQTNEHLEELGSRYRKEITTELSDHYRQTIGVEQGAIRIGVILCMQQIFKVVIKRLLHRRPWKAHLNGETNRNMERVFSKMAVKCLVCGKPTSVTHMGMDACRACTVFYRRNRAKRLLCVKGYRGCMNDPKHAFGCRKCRLARFEAILKAGTDDDKNIIFSTPTKTPIIDRIRANYNALSMFRRNAELNFRGIHVDFTEPYDEKRDIIPSTYQYMNEGKKIQITGLFKYIPSMFPEFRVLPNADKWLLIRNCHRSFHCLDSALRVLRIYGKDSFDFLFLSYTTIISKESIGHFFDDCPDPTNADAATKTFAGTIHNVVSLMRNQCRQVDPSDDEFMALMGLAFWSFENIDPSEELLALAERYRASIISELTSYYRSRMSKQRGTSRVGILLCFLQEFRRAEMILQSDYDIFHMLGVFDDDTVTYSLEIR